MGRLSKLTDGVSLFLVALVVIFVLIMRLLLIVVLPVVALLSVVVVVASSLSASLESLALEPALIVLLAPTMASSTSIVSRPARFQTFSLHRLAADFLALVNMRSY